MNPAPESFFAGDGFVRADFGGLLDFVNGAKVCTKKISARNFCGFFFNLVLSLANGCDSELFDSDMECPSLDCAENFEVARARFSSTDDLLRAVKNSTSRIFIKTSGTSGAPKIVARAVADFVSQTRSKKNPDERRVWAFAFNPVHMGGLQVFFQAFLCGDGFVNVFAKPRDEVFSAFENFGITHVSATPSFYRFLFPCEKIFPFVMRATCGGEKSDERLFERLAGIFPNARFCDIYATTEFGVVLVSKNGLFRIPSRLGKFAKIENGELFMAHQIFPSENAEGADAKKNMDNEFKATGDFVESFADGSFRFTGRSCDFVQVGGNKVNLAEVDSVLCALDCVEEARSYGRPNSLLGNVVCCEIRLANGAAETEASLRAKLEGKLERFKIPRKINFVEKLGISANGKVKR